MESKRSNLNNSEIYIEIEENLLCPITLEIMKDPVIILQTKQVYDRKNIEKWFQGHSTCPLTGMKLSSKAIIDIPAFKSFIDKFIEGMPELQKEKLHTITDLDSRFKSLEEKFEGKVIEYGKLEESHSQIFDELVTLTKEINNLNEEKKELVTNNDNYLKTITYQGNKIDEIDRKCKIYSNKIEELEKEIKDKTALIQILNSEINNLNNNIISLKDENTNLLANITKINEDFKKLIENRKKEHNERFKNDQIQISQLTEQIHKENKELNKFYNEQVKFIESIYLEKDKILQMNEKYNEIITKTSEKFQKNEMKTLKKIVEESIIVKNKKMMELKNEEKRKITNEKLKLEKFIEEEKERIQKLEMKSDEFLKIEEMEEDKNIVNLLENEENKIKEEIEIELNHSKKLANERDNYLTSILNSISTKEIDDYKIKFEKLQEYKSSQVENYVKKVENLKTFIDSNSDDVQLNLFWNTYQNIEESLNFELCVIETKHTDVINCFLEISNEIFCTGSKDGFIKIWYIKDGKFDNKYTFSYYSKAVINLVNINNNMIGSSHEDGNIIIWKEINNGEFIQDDIIIGNSNDEIIFLQFVNGKYLISSNNNGTIIIRLIKDGKFEIEYVLDFGYETADYQVEEESSIFNYFTGSKSEKKEQIKKPIIANCMLDYESDKDNSILFGLSNGEIEIYEKKYLPNFQESNGSLNKDKKSSILILKKLSSDRFISYSNDGKIVVWKKSHILFTDCQSIDTSSFNSITSFLVYSDDIFIISREDKTVSFWNNSDKNDCNFQSVKSNNINTKVKSMIKLSEDKILLALDYKEINLILMKLNR